jgi:hypothetical protein
MDKFWPYLGGIIGGYTFVQAPVGGTALAGLEPILDIVGALSMIVFAGALIVRGVRLMIGK